MKLKVIVFWEKRGVVLLKQTDVSDMCTASIIRAIHCKLRPDY
jgi:hypothetical protein